MVITGTEVVVVGNVIIQIIKLATTAQIFQKSCGEFKEYIQSIQVPVNIIMKTDVMKYSETKRHTKRLIHLLKDSQSLLQYCSEKKLYQNWFGKPSSIPGKLTAKREEIKECLDLVNKGLERRKKAEAEASRKKEERRYRDLLTQKITDCQASWTESKAKFENVDINRERRETMFREHVAGLLKVAKRDYRLLLKEVIGKEKRMSWDHAKQKLENHFRYKNLPRKERRELFDEYVKGHKKKQG